MKTKIEHARMSKRQKVHFPLNRTNSGKTVLEGSCNFYQIFYILLIKSAGQNTSVLKNIKNKVDSDVF